MVRRVAVWAMLAWWGASLFTNGAFAQTAWEQYRRQLEQWRDMQGRRIDEWRQRRDQSYEQWRNQAGQAGDADVQVNLQDSNILPGDYAIQLPFGLQARVRVAPRPGEQPPQPTWGGSFYAQIGNVTRRINDGLRDIRYGVYQTNHSELQEQVDAAIEAADDLQRFALQRAHESQLREQFEAFDQNWHRLAHQLAQHKYLNATWIEREAETVSYHDNLLHQLLRVGESSAYDRVRVAALTRQLANVTEHLLQDVKLEARDNPHVELLRRRMQRVQRLAADLEQAVAQDVSLGAILDEYEEFDQAWHRLLATARQSPELGDHLQQMGRRVRAVDLELHRELKVNPPVIVDPGRIRNLASSVAQQADHLAEDIRFGAGERDRELRRIAEDFAAAARDLQRAVSGPVSNEAEAAQWVQRYWNTLGARLDRLRGDDAEHVQERAARLDADLKELLALLAERR